MMVPVGGVRTLSTVNMLAKRPILSWAAMQAFSMHRFWTETREPRHQGQTTQRSFVASDAPDEADWSIDRSLGSLYVFCVRLGLCLGMQM